MMFPLMLSRSAPFRGWRESGAVHGVCVSLLCRPSGEEITRAVSPARFALPSLAAFPWFLAVPGGVLLVLGAAALLWPPSGELGGSSAKNRAEA